MSNHGFLIAFLICVVVILFALITLALMAISARRQRAAEPRIRPERAEPCDLAEERFEFERRRDAYIEARYLGRAA